MYHVRYTVAWTPYGTWYRLPLHLDKFEFKTFHYSDHAYMLVTELRYAGAVFTVSRPTDSPRSPWELA